MVVSGWSCGISVVNGERCWQCWRVAGGLLAAAGGANRQWHGGAVACGRAPPRTNNSMNMPQIRPSKAQTRQAECASFLSEQGLGESFLSEQGLGESRARTALRWPPDHCTVMTHASDLLRQSSCVAARFG